MGDAAVAGPEPDPIPTPEPTPLYHSLERLRYVRQEQIRAIEKRTGRCLIAFVAGALTSISSIDIPPFIDILDDIEPGSDLDLLLHTPGGDVDQAERIVLLCRKRVGAGAFRVIVPDSAKSAGTLIAIAADSIVMGEPSELGPIDPQVTITTARGEPMVRPAQSFLDGLNAIIEQAESGLSPAYFPLLDKLDPALIDFCQKALLRSEQFAEKFLTKHMLSDDPEKAKEVAHTLNHANTHLSHGAVIDAERAIALGLNVELLPYDDDLWQAYWRLYCDMRTALRESNSRLFEGRRASLMS